MKLGLKIIETFEGDQPAGTIINNNSVLKRYASSARSYIDGLENFYGTSKILHFVRYLGNDGLLICIVQAQPEGSARPKDNTAAWIHIPSRIDIDEDDFDNVLSKTKQFLSGNLPESDLNDLYSKTYSEKNVLFTIIDTIQSDSNGKLGALYYDKNTLHSFRELCNLQFLANQSFGKYKAILLINNSDEIKMLGENTLTSSNLALTQIVTLPSPANKYDFTPFIQGLNFNRAIEALKDERLIVIWRKNGYKDIEKTVIVRDNDKFQHDVQITTSEIMRMIPRSIIQVVNKENNLPIKNCTVTINEQQFLQNHIYISENDFRDGVTVGVTANGYERYEEVCNLSLVGDVLVEMTPLKYERTIILPAKHGDNIYRDINIKLESAGERIYNSPLKGYKLKDGYLIYGNQLKLKAKYFLLGVASLLVVLLLHTGYKALKTFSDENIITKKYPFYEPKDTVKNRDAIDYLNKSEWIKSELERHDCLKGFFDELDNYDYKNIQKRYEDYNLQESENFTKIIKLIRDPDGVNEIYKYGNIYLTQVNDDTITVTRYIDKLHKAKLNAIKYLNDNQEWNKDQLDIHAPGLFEDLNNFDFEKIEKWGEELKGSNKLGDILEVFQKEAFERNKFENSQYDTQKKIIEVDAYIDRLKKEGLKKEEEKSTLSSSPQEESKKTKKTKRGGK